MPRNPRPKGNGPGWGGPRKGEGNKAAGPGRPKGVKDGEGKKARAQAALENAAEDAALVVLKVMKDATDPRNLAAAQHVLLRTLGDPAKKIELTGEGGGPMVIRRIVVDPKGGVNADG